MESGSTPPDPTPGDRIPRGAIAVVVVGLIATIAAALLTGGSGSGEAAHLEFVKQRAIPASEAVTVPGSTDAKMQLLEGKIQTTGTNVAGYSLFRVVSTLKIDEGAPVSKGRIVCSVHATRSGTEIAQSSNGLRTTYPRSSEDGIYGQETPETVLVEFASHGDELAVLEVDDLEHERFTTIEGVKLEWPHYEVGTENLRYFLPEGKPKGVIELPFYTIWKTTKPPAATVSCTLEVAAGKATVKTAGSLPKIAPAINEEAEEEKQEEREEAEEAAGEGEEGE
ncbi:MAG TPA: hypothetical protein VMH33_03850 [Solirubrobacterales bacterium]|nr:hypothetical protein [Solirubrobacterales bacterium]